MTTRLASARSTLLGIGIVTVLLVWALRDLALLIGYAVLVAYALLPAVKAIERVRDSRGRHLPRGLVAGAVMLTLVGIVGWLVALAIPRLGTEATHFAAIAPQVLARIVDDLRAFGAAHGLSAWLDPAIDNARSDAAGLVANMGGTLAQGAGRVFGGLGRLLGVALLPLLAFYLLAESDAVSVSALRFVPEQARPEITRLGAAVDRALRSYVRGQAIVCVVTGALVGAGLALLHHPAALLLGLLAGAAELIPYLGFMATAAAIALAGSSVGPAQVVLGLALYTGLNWAIGALVTPRLMGRYLKMHPFVVTVSVLAGAQLLGPAGALLALPGAAVLQAVIEELAPGPTRAAKRDAAASTASQK
ncbi:MAG TPA: AI-2E family transporter [Candidatus Saccharimonadaceae bacterium]|jgi:predicted PurR-regulated permease PerM|nr:AI-2E family transporter [Candidatus Saccharimonadaceae bacterium]